MTASTFLRLNLPPPHPPPHLHTSHPLCHPLARTHGLSPIPRAHAHDLALPNTYTEVPRQYQEPSSSSTATALHTHTQHDSTANGFLDGTRTCLFKLAETVPHVGRISFTCAFRPEEQGVRTVVRAARGVGDEAAVACRCRGWGLVPRLRAGRAGQTGQTGQTRRTGRSR